MSISIGITERGDAALDLSWIKLIDYMNGAIIISKGYNDDFNDALLKYKQKIIYHATCTGLGSSMLEPNVPFYVNQIDNIKRLIERGFPIDHIVVRIDPIIPKSIFLQLDNYSDYIDEQYNFSLDKEYKYVAIIMDIIGKCVDLGIRRFRYSFLDIYPHVMERLKSKNILIYEKEIKKIECDDWMNQFDNIEDNVYFKDNQIKRNEDEIYYIHPKDLTLHFESCSEANVREYHKTGCVSERDFKTLGLDINECNGSSNQRPLCLCCSAKTEMLKNKTRCGHGCVYCYWKD